MARTLVVLKHLFHLFLRPSSPPDCQLPQQINRFRAIPARIRAGNILSTFILALSAARAEPAKVECSQGAVPMGRLPLRAFEGKFSLEGPQGPGHPLPGSEFNLAGRPRANFAQRDPSAELSRSSKVSDRRGNAQKPFHNRSESLCAGLWAPCRVLWVLFGFAFGPIPGRTRRFPAGSFKVFGTLLSQPRRG